MQKGSIYPGSTEWNYTQFRLQLILSQPNIQILSISKNMQAQGYFAQRQNYFKIDAAIDVKSQNESQIMYLKQNTKKGAFFKCGRIQQDCKLTDGMGSVKVYRIIFFKIAVKDVLSIYQSNSISRQDLLAVTDEYDSVYLSNRKEQMSIYDHQYFIKSPNQYVWEFDIQYRYTNSNQPTSRAKKWTPDSQKCEECQTNKAYWFCVQQKQIFCQDCYQDSHRSKNRNSHRKEHINPFNCHKKCERAAHNQKPLQFYCFNCKGLKCQKCLNDTSHMILNRSSSNFDKSTNNKKSQDSKFGRNGHQFVQVRQLIGLFKQKQKQLNQNLKSKLIVKIKQIQTVIDSISRMFQKKLQKLQDQLTISIIKLRKQSRRQINNAVSVHLQLKRKFDQILWIQKFVEYNQEALDAASNIQLKQSFSSFVTIMNSEQYFSKIQRKITELKKIS